MALLKHLFHVACVQTIYLHLFNLFEVEDRWTKPSIFSIFSLKIVITSCMYNFHCSCKPQLFYLYFFLMMKLYFKWRNLSWNFRGKLYSITWFKLFRNNYVEKSASLKSVINLDPCVLIGHGYDAEGVVWLYETQVFRKVSFFWIAPSYRASITHSGYCFYACSETTT